MIQTFNTLRNDKIGIFWGENTAFKVGDAVVLTEDWNPPLPQCLPNTPCPQPKNAQAGTKGYIAAVNGFNLDWISGGTGRAPLRSQFPGQDQWGNWSPPTYKINIPGMGNSPSYTIDYVPQSILLPTIIGNEVLQAVWYGTKPSQKLIAAAIIALLIYFIAKKFKK